MPGEVIRLDPRANFTEIVRRAADVMRGGGLVAFPTETVYGLGVRADNGAALKRLQSVKGREASKAFTVHLGAKDQAQHFAPGLSGLAKRLIRKGWPGPLTLIVPVDEPSKTPVVLERNEGLADAIYFDGTIGMRCPDHPFAEALLRAVDAPVVASSANAAAQPAPYSANAVSADILAQIDVLIDAGTTKYAKPSTIVRVDGSDYKIVREGVFDSGMVKRLMSLRILFVCSGNTCRSPMAAGFAEEQLAQRLDCSTDHLHLRGVFVQSAGSSGGSGGASEYALRVMRKRGIDLSKHYSTSLSRTLVEQADFIYVMTDAHRDAVLDLVPSAQGKTTLLLENEDVADPLGGTEEDYEKCARKIEAGLKTRLEELIL